MRRSRLWWFLLSMTVLVPAAARADIAWNLNISNAPPPPVVVVREQPHMILVPNTTVYMVNDDSYGYDYFRYGVFWYISRGGYWYRARSYRGPFRVVEVRYVPHAILNVPGRYWRHPHGGPPGQLKKRENVVVVREDEQGNNGNGHGHGRGHGKH